jgi:hypothetical protein
MNKIPFYNFVESWVHPRQFTLSCPDLVLLLNTSFTLSYYSEGLEVSPWKRSPVTCKSEETASKSGSIFQWGIKMSFPECVNHWRRAVYLEFFKGIIPKTIIVNQQDLEDYTIFIVEKYGGIIPTNSKGEMCYKNIPIGISNSLKRNECTIVLE